MAHKVVRMRKGKGDPMDATEGGMVMTDGFGRRVDYLRISITDRCNERCLYCMPHGYRGWSGREDHLTVEEIAGVVRAAVRLGFRKFRITGGEPLLRGDVVDICRRVSSVPGVESLGLSTNGTRLAAMAADLRAAGVGSVNVSLDALDAALYRRITGGPVEEVLTGIDAAVNGGFRSIKLNCVLMRHVNEGEILPLVGFAAERGLPIRFIELMPLSAVQRLTAENFLSAGEVEARLGESGVWSEAPVVEAANGPAVYRKLDPPGAVIGFVAALTKPGFCATCNKLRLTADGKLRPCLGRHGEVDLRTALREGQDIEEVLARVVAQKPEAHEFLEAYEPGRPMTAIGG